MTRARQGAKAWRRVTSLVESTRTQHSDFYGLAAELDETLRATESLTSTLADRVQHYKDVPGVYDDTRVLDPGERLDDAARALLRLSAIVGQARCHNDAFWSAISHIGVDVQR